MLAIVSAATSLNEVDRHSPDLVGFLEEEHCLDPACESLKVVCLGIRMAPSS